MRGLGLFFGAATLFFRQQACLLQLTLALRFDLLLALVLGLYPGADKLLRQCAERQLVRCQLLLRRLQTRTSVEIAGIPPVCDPGGRVFADLILQFNQRPIFAHQLLEPRPGLDQFFMGDGNVARIPHGGCLFGGQWIIGGNQAGVGQGLHHFFHLVGVHARRQQFGKCGCTACINRAAPHFDQAHKDLAGNPLFGGREVDKLRIRMPL